MQYTVVISEEPGGQWRAAALLLPDCAAVAPTREQALEQIKNKLIAAAPRLEVVRIEVPTNISQNGQSASANFEEQWPGFGAFKNDPWLDQIFDEIERQRDASLGGE